MSTSHNKSVQRAATRAPLGKPIRLQPDDSMEVIDGVCMNISIGGMFIQCSQTRPQGSLLRFELPLDEGASVRGLGEVVWMRPKSAGPGSEPGIGLKFRFLEQRDRQLIYKLVSQYIKERLSKQSAQSAVRPEPPKVSPTPRGVFHPPDRAVARPSSPESPAAADASNRREGLSGFDPPAPLSPAELSARVPDASPGSSDDAHDRPGRLGEDELGARHPDPGSAYEETDLEDEALEDHQLYPEHGVGTARRRPSPTVLVALAVMVAVLVAAFLLRDRLFGGGHDGEPAVVPPPAVVTPTGEPSAPGSADPVDDSDVVSTTGTASTDRPGGATEETPATPPGEVTSSPQPLPVGESPPVVRAGYTRIVDVRWSETADGLRVVFEGDGPITQQRYRHFRLDGDPAREVIQFQGVEEGFEPTRIDVGGPGVEQIRTGFHRKRGGGDELHVVMDMTSREAHVVEKRSVGFSLEVLVSLGSPR